MSKKVLLKWLSILIIVVIFIYLLFVGLFPKPGTSIQASLQGLPIVQGDFQQAAREGFVFQFPPDHGPHEAYQTEWWYYTGNLQTNEGRAFGYQLTFFRRSLLPKEGIVDRESNWAFNQVYLAHFTLTDIDAEQFAYWEKISRGAADLAGATGSPTFEVWLYDWVVKQIGDGTFELMAGEDEIQVNLVLEDTKGPILQGENGYSQKGQQEGNASYYYSQTRLKSTGIVKIGENEMDVAGFSWMDHEFSTSALSDGQIGWDWFSIQLDDNRELMVYNIRREDGSVDPFSSGMIIYEDGSAQRLLSEDFTIFVGDFWQSERSEVTYPSSWIIDIPSERINLTITPKVEDQELIVSFIYWEGAVSVEGLWNEQPVSGNGYVEMTGYAASMQGQF